MTVDLPALLTDALSALRDSELEHAVMGGCARNAYAEPRATKDVDFVVAVDAAKHEGLLEAFCARGFHPATTVGSAEPVPDLILFRDPSGRRIDVFFAHTEFERSALSRRRPRELVEGEHTPVVSLEDLVVYKLVADRPQDRVDISCVSRARRTGRVGVHRGVGGRLGGERAAGAAARVPRGLTITPPSVRAATP